MGEVFLGEDVRLGRRVAIKVLPLDVCCVPESVERFQREARIISSLNHPNICTLFDIGAHDGRQFMVMELLEGATLGARLGEGPLALDDALAFARRRGSGARRRSSPGDRAPRHQAGQPLRHLGVGPQGARLRRRQARRCQRRCRRSDQRRYESAHHGRHGRGDRGLHVAGAGARRGHRRPQRPVLARRRALRDGRRPPALRRRHAGRDLRRPPHQDARAALGAACGSAGRVRCHRPQGAREGAVAPLPVGGRAAGGPAGAAPGFGAALRGGARLHLGCGPFEGVVARRATGDGRAGGQRGGLSVGTHAGARIPRSRGAFGPHQPHRRRDVRRHARRGAGRAAASVAVPESRVGSTGPGHAAHDAARARHPRRHDGRPRAVPAGGRPRPC